MESQREFIFFKLHAENNNSFRLENASSEEATN